MVPLPPYYDPFPSRSYCPWFGLGFEKFKRQTGEESHSWPWSVYVDFPENRDDLDYPIPFQAIRDQTALRHPP